MAEVDGGCLSLSKSISSRSTQKHAGKAAAATIPPDSLYYPMNNRGKCLLLNYSKFSIPNTSDRSGTDVDREKLVRTFGELLGFDVKLKENLTRRETLDLIKKVARQDHSSSDAFIFIFMSHGYYGGTLSTTDGYITYDDIFNEFKPDVCPSLKGKPKLFFFQACQGEERDSGVRLQLDGNNRTGFLDYKIPTHCDFLAAFSTVPNYVSYRDKVNGSWFIRSLVSEVEQHWQTLDLVSILTLVNQKVAIDLLSVPFNEKQAPVFSSTLTRFVRFENGSGNNNSHNNNNVADNYTTATDHAPSAEIESMNGGRHLETVDSNDVQNNPN